MNDKSPSILYSIPIIRDLFENENDLDYNPNAKKRAIILLSSIIICIFLFVFVVSLMISKHNNNLVKVITVPNCVSSSINEAKALLEESEITEDKYTFISTPSSIEEKDKIINQSIEAGTEIPENQILQLFFGDGTISEEEALKEIPIERVVFEPSELTMSVGDIQVFDIKVIPENSTEQYFITCDNYSVAFTDVNNNVHAFSPGEAKLIAKTVEGKIVGECHITINELDSATIQTDSFELPSQVYESTRAHETTQAYDAPQEWTDEETKTTTTRPPVTAKSEPEAVSRPTAAPEYTVYFYSDGVFVSSKTVTYGAYYGLLPNPTKSGYIFKGWYTGDGQPITRISTVRINGDQTLYALWEKETTTTTRQDTTAEKSTAVLTRPTTTAKPTTTTTKRPTTTTRPATQYIKGDIDGDGYVTYEDFNWLCDYLAGEKQLTEDQKRRADVDGSGKPDEGDKAKLLKLIP